MSFTLRTMALYDVLVRHANMFLYHWRNRPAAHREPYTAEEADFLPASLALIERPVSPTARLTGVSLVLLTGCIIAWALFAHVDIIVKATGKVIPSGRTKAIASVDVASVRAIHVTEGQRVRAGDVLIELDARMFEADEQKAQAEVNGARLEVARSKALIESLDQGRPPTLKPVAGTSPEDYEQAVYHVRGQYLDYEAKLSELKGEIHRYALALPLAQQRSDAYGELVATHDVSANSWSEKRQAVVDLDGQLLQAQNSRMSLIATTRREALDSLTEAETRANSGTVTMTGPLDSSATVNGDSNTLSEGGNEDLLVVNGNNNHVVTTGTGGETTLTGSGNTLTANDFLVNLTNNGSGSLTLTGTGKTLIVGTSDTVTLGASTSVAITGNSDTIQGGAGDSVSLNGSSEVLTEGSGSTFTVNGSTNQLTISAASSTATLTGSGDTVSATSDALNLGNNSTATITGNSNTVSLGTGVAVTLNGTGESVTGSSAFLTLGASNSATLTGTSDNATLSTGDTLTLGASTSATVTDTGGSVKGGTSDTVTVNGSGNTLTEAASSTFAVNGSSNQLTISAASSTATLTGSGDTVNATSDTVNLANSSTATITGNNDTISVGTTVAATLNGTGETVTGNSAFLTLGTSSSATLTGISDNVTLGSGDTLTLGASTAGHHHRHRWNSQWRWFRHPHD